MKILTETKNSAEIAFLYFTEWGRRGNARWTDRSKLSNKERRWPGTDVSNILVFGPRAGWSVSQMVKTQSGQEYISAGETVEIRAGMFEVLSTKVSTVTIVRQSWFKTTLSPVLISSESAIISFIPSDRHLVFSKPIATSSDTECAIRCKRRFFYLRARIFRT